MKVYRVEKHDGRTDKWFDYGTMCMEDAKLVIRGYKKNNDEFLTDLFGDDDFAGMYTRKGTQTFFSVELA